MIRYFINNSVAVIVLCITIILFGVLALVSLPIQLTPNVKTPAITVTTVYPGATPEDVEQDILVDQERFLRSVPGLKKMISEASFGAGSITLEFDVATDMQESLVRVNNALSQVPSYPENVDEPQLSTSSNSDQPVAWFSIRALPGHENDVNIAAQYDLAEDFVKTRFERIPGVASVQGVYGGSPKEMQVYLDPYKLADRRISIFQVREAIRGNNRDVSGGDLWEGKRRYTVRTVGRVQTPEDVENIIITHRDGASIRVGDVGYATLSVAKSRSLIRHNGRPALAMGVRHQPGTNLLVVMDEVRKAAAELNDGVLKQNNMRINQVTDDTEYVSESVAMVRDNLLIGGVLAFLTLLIFLRHIRSTLIIALAIPLSIVGSLFLINSMGRTINVISLAGLAFSIGSVLDNSIVVLENIFRHRQMGKDSFTAAFDGTDEVWTAILASTTTNVIVFLPIIGLKEQAGQLFGDLAVAITASNIMSLIVAILVIPCFSARLLRVMPHVPKVAMGAWAYNLFGFAPVAARMQATLERLLRFVLGHLFGRLALVLGMGTIAILLIFVFMPKTEYLPEGNQNSVFGLLIPPQGYSVEEMSSIGENLEVAFRPYVEGSVEDYRSGKLDAPPLRDFFFASFEGMMFVFTRGKDNETAALLPDLIRREFSKVPGSIAISSQRSIFEGNLRGSRGIDIDIVGPEVPQLTFVGLQGFLSILQNPKLAGAQTIPEPGIEIGQPQLTIRPNWVRAAEVGISAQAIGYGAWVLGDGAYADDFYQNGRKYDLYMYSSLNAYDTLSNFDNMKISTDEGVVVPISSVADFSFDFVPQKIRRVNQQRAVTLQVVPPTNLSLEETLDVIENEVIKDLKDKGMVPPGYEIRIAGSSDKLKAMVNALSADFVLALVLIYLLLVLIFKHWGHPLTILFSVPIGLTGGVLGLFLLNRYLHLVSGGTIVQSLDVLTMLGFVILLGAVVNNPILIVEQSLNFMEQGMERHEAIVQATMSRIRPILMTTGTTVLGLLPLVLIPGAGSELYRGLGVVMFGGLFLGTVTTVFFIPSVMVLIYDFIDWFGKTRFGVSSSRMIHKIEE
ncbi:MMPL family transporter [bacterium]|nr:MMPL family transporter [bacterium]